MWLSDICLEAIDWVKKSKKCRRKKIVISKIKKKLKRIEIKFLDPYGVKTTT